MAVSKGGTLTLGSKRPLITMAFSVPPASQAATLTSQDRELTPATIFQPSMAQSVDELNLPQSLNLHESGLRLLEPIKALQQKRPQISTCCMGYRNTQICISFDYPFLICQPCHCSRS